MAGPTKRKADGPAGDEDRGSEDEMEQQLRDHAVLAYNEFVRAFQRRASERIAANRVAIDLHLRTRARARLAYPAHWRSAHVDAWQNVERARTSEQESVPDRVRKTARTDVRTNHESVSMVRHAVVLPRVPPRPGGMMWTGIIKNYDVEDQPDLQHKPYFGDDDDEDVVSEYYQLHRLQGTSTCEVDFIKELCDAVLRQLMETWELSICDLKVVARAIQVEANVVIEVHKLIKKATENAEAKKRAQSRGNVTTPTAAAASAALAGDYETVVDTFRKFFCRRCYVYDCDYHPYNPEDVPKLSIGESNAVYEAIKSKATSPGGIARNCGNDCILGQTQTSARLSKSRLVDSAFGWDAGERALCARAYLICGGSFCEMAKLLGGSKTCMDVAEFCEFNDINDQALALERKARPYMRRTTKKSKKNKYRPSISHLTHIEPKMRDIIQTTIVPCAHHGPCDDAAHCSCRENGWLCSKLCVCIHEECKIFYSGCRCQRGRCRTKACPCFASGRECDPDLCRVCCADQHALLLTFGDKDAKVTDPKSDTSCQNRNLQLRKRKHVRLGRSTEAGAGWGLFVDEPVAKDEFIIEYIGEMVTHIEAERRGLVYDKLNRSYLFNLDTNTVIDATRKGNKTRFINHSDKKPNCYPKIINVNSDFRIGLYAARDIEPHSELFFNYGHDKDLKHEVLHKQATIPAWMKNDR